MLEGVLALCDTIPWIDPLDRIEYAEHKIIQLQHAAECGLTIPRTIVSNDPERVRQFITTSTCPTIVKMLSPVSISVEGTEKTVFTSDVGDCSFDMLQGLRFAPMMFQQKIDRKYDVRVTIVGDLLFATAIRMPRDAADETDWRVLSDPGAYCTPIVLPPSVREQLLLLMGCLGLKFGAVDLIVTPANEYVFLEINPCGDWSWLPDYMQAEIADAISNLLVSISTGNDR